MQKGIYAPLLPRLRSIVEEGAEWAEESEVMNNYRETISGHRRVAAHKNS